MLKKELITQALINGERPADIATKYHCSTAYVSIIKNGRGDHAHGRLTTALQIQIAFLWGADLSVDQIARKLYLGDLQIINFLNREELINAKPH